jgi:hypothetical protein
VSENRVLRGIFGNLGGAGDWRKLHDEELHDLYTLNCRDFIREVVMGGTCEL